MTVEELTQILKEYGHNDRYSYGLMRFTQEKLDIAMANLPIYYRDRLTILIGKPQSEWTNVDMFDYKGKPLSHHPVARLATIRTALKQLSYKLYEIPDHAKADNELVCPYCGGGIAIKLIKREQC